MNLNDALADPFWLPMALSADLKSLTFTRVTRQALADSPFLDHRIRVDNRQDRTVDLTSTDLAEAVAELSGRNPLPAFVFHTSFCRSTLLTRALDIDGSCLMLREPAVMFDAANMLRTPDSQADTQTKRILTELVIRLLGRRLSANERVVVKPTNLANSWLGYAMAVESKILLMHSSLHSFLVSILMRGEPGRLFARQIVGALIQEGAAVAKMTTARALLLTDIQMAALGWRQQMEIFSAAVARAREGTIKTLDGAELVIKPRATLEAAAALFELELPVNKLSRIMSGSVFSEDPKHPGHTFKESHNQALRSTTESVFAEALRDTLEWAQSLNFGTNLRLPLLAPLI